MQEEYWACFTISENIVSNFRTIFDLQLATWIATQSKGAPIAVPQAHPKEIEAYRVGEKLFHHRAGPYDFACSTCHSAAPSDSSMWP